MRRFIVAVVLIAGGWSQLVAIQCPVGQSSHYAEDGTSHAHAGTDTGTAISVPESGHEPADCQFTMRCTSPALNSSLASIHAALELVRADLRPAAAAFSTTLLTHDPPPPRLPV